MANVTPLPDRYLGSADAAAFYGYSVSHFRALIRAGKVPQPLRLNGKLMWRESLLNAHARALEIAQGVIPNNAA